MGGKFRRRELLYSSGLVGTIGLSGCTGVFDDDDSTPPPGDDEPRDDEEPPDDDDTTESEVPDDEESTEPDDSTPQNESPAIVDFDAESTDYGTTLLVTLEGEDDQGIGQAAINYGDLGIEKTPDNGTVTVEEELTDIHEAELDETPGTVVFTLEDVEGEVTEEIHQPHTDSPSVSLEATATSNPGELVVKIEADDQFGLHWIQIAASGESIEEIDVTGSDETDHEFSTDADAISDEEVNGITATVRNTFGSTRSTAEDQYVREFEPLEDQDIEIGAVYMPFFEWEEQWDDCAVGTPAVGTYYMDDEEALNRHGDLMEGFGITRLQFDFKNVDHWRPFLQTRENTILEQVPLEAMYVIWNSMNWRDEGKSVGEELDESLGIIRNEFFEQENYAVGEGRPIVKFWSIRGVTSEGNEVNDYIGNEFEGFREFGD